MKPVAAVPHVCQRYRRRRRYHSPFLSLVALLVAMLLPALTAPQLLGASRAVVLGAGEGAGQAVFKVGSFTKKSDGTGLQTVAHGLGATPKAIIFWTSGSQAAAGTWEPHIHQVVGVTAGPTNSYAVNGVAVDGQTTTNTSRRMAAKAITRDNSNGTGATFEADLDSWDATNFVLNWTTNPASGEARVFMFLAIGGAGVQAKVLNWQPATATGNQSVTGLDFKPDLAFHISNIVGGMNTSTAEHRVGLGVMNSAGQQWANAVYSQDGAAAGNTSRWQRTDSCLVQMSANEAQSQRAAFVSMDYAGTAGTGGFTVNWTTVWSTTTQAASLCIKGVSSKIGAFSKTANAASQSIGRVGFQPEAVLFADVGDDPRSTPMSQAFWGLGAYDGTDHRLSYQTDMDAVNPTQADSLFLNDAAITANAGNGGALYYKGTVSAVNADGFDLAWSATSVSVRESLYVALGEPGTNTFPKYVDSSTFLGATLRWNGRRIDRCQNGVLWASIYPGSSTRGIEFWYSTDNGVTWNEAVTGHTFGNSAYSAMFIDLDDYCHVAYEYAGNTRYRRGTPNAERTGWTWSAEHLIGGGSTDHNYPDLVAHREGSDWKVHVVWSYLAGSTNQTYYIPITVTSGGTITPGTAAVIGGSYGVSGQYTLPSIDFNHTGDGKTVSGSTPHLYSAWSAGTTGAGKGVRFRKATYSAGAWTWGTEREVSSTHYVNGELYHLTCFFDGTRAVMAGLLSTATNTDLMVWDRDVADTTTTTHTLQTSVPIGQRLHYGGSSYDSSGNVYLFGQSESTNPCRVGYRKWTRSGASLGAWTDLDSAPDASRFGMKRGHSSNRIEWVYVHGATSPYAVKYDRIAL